jgi:hypothetical protein
MKNLIKSPVLSTILKGVFIAITFIVILFLLYMVFVEAGIFTAIVCLVLFVNQTRVNMQQKTISKIVNSVWEYMDTFGKVIDKLK